MPESSSSTESRFVVARLGRPHGLDGYLGLYVEEADAVYFQPESTVFIEDRPYTVLAVRRGDRGYQVQFMDVGSREAAEAIRGQDISVGELRDLDDDEFWPDDLVGLEVRLPGGDVVGRVIEFVPGAAQDRLAVLVDTERYEVPFVSAFVPVVDVPSGYVEVTPIPGLIEPLS